MSELVKTMMDGEFALLATRQIDGHIFAQSVSRSVGFASYRIVSNPYPSLVPIIHTSWKHLNYSRNGYDVTISIYATEDGDEDVTEIPLPNVKATVLSKVIEFCTHHRDEPMTEIEKPLKSAIMSEVVQKWYADFVNVEQVLLFELILAANYMDIKPLLDLTCATVASMIKGKTPEEIRQTFNITNDFSPEEEAQVREENKWCEEA